MNVWASRETWEAYLLGAYAGHHRAKVIAPLEEFSVGDWRVIGFPVIHDAPGTLGFLVSGQGGKLLYLTDTAFTEFKFPGLTHIAVECNWSEEAIRANTRSGEVSSERFKRTVNNHMSLERVIRFLQANDLTTVKEIHLLHLSDTNSDEQEFKQAAMKATGKPVFIAAKAVQV